MAGMFPSNKEISVFGKTVCFPGVTDEGEFTNGDFSNPSVPPSYLDAETMNLILHNLNNLIAQLSGHEANNTDKNQLAALFTVAATALRGVQRDERGRAKVAAPLEDDDIARKAEIDAEAKTRSDDDIAISTSLSNHTHSKENPHGVTKAQVGLGNVDNTADKDKTVKSAGACTGNAATATKWQTARNINGMSVQGDANRVNYAVCSTAAGTQAKACDCAGFALVTGAEITVKFSNTNTQANPTLNVNGTGAKAIYYRGSAIAAGYLAANRTYTFRYNGTQYELVGDINTDTNTTYSVFTKSGSGASAGLVPAPSTTAGATKYLREDGTWQVPPNTTYTHPTTSGNKHIPVGGSAGQILRWSADGTAVWGTDNNTTYNEATTSVAGLMSATDKSRLNNNYVTASNFGTNSGYIKYSNGLLVQWASSTPTSTGQGGVSKNLPIAFSSENFSVFLSLESTNVQWTSGVITPQYKIEGNGTVKYWTSNEVKAVRFFAIGY